MSLAASDTGVTVARMRNPASLVSLATVWLAIGTSALAAAPLVFGPLKTGDAVECAFGGWAKGRVELADGLTYLVRLDTDSGGRYLNIYHLSGVRPIGGTQTYAETFSGTLPDPEGGPVAIGARVELNDGYKWLPARVSRRVGARYWVFNETKGYTPMPEAWLTADQLRPLGGGQPFAPAAKPFQPNHPKDGASLRVGDEIEVKTSTGFYPSTILSIDGARYFHRGGAQSAVRGWTTLAEMRPFGGGPSFAVEDLSVFAGRWRLSGDAFFTTKDSKSDGRKITSTMELNSGAGADAGLLTIKGDGTYILAKTTVFHDAPGKWIANPDQAEGGILLKGGDSEGRDALVRMQKDGTLYLQHAIRGPGKVATKL